jgi:hypothetical protein
LKQPVFNRSFFYSLKSLTVSHCITDEATRSNDLALLSQLTNLEKICFDDMYNLNDDAVMNFSALTMLKSITVKFTNSFGYLKNRLLSHIGLWNMVKNKHYLEDLTLKGVIISYTHDEFCCLSNLTNLTSVDIEDGLSFGLSFYFFSKSLIFLKSVTISLPSTKIRLGFHGQERYFQLDPFTGLIDWLSESYVHYPEVSTEGLDSLTRLNILETLVFENVNNLTRNATKNYSTLTKLTSLTIINCSDIGIDVFINMVDNKELIYLKLMNLQGFEVMRFRGLGRRNDAASCLCAILTNNRTVVDLDIFVNNETTRAEFIEYHSSILGSN